MHCTHYSSYVCAICKWKILRYARGPKMPHDFFFYDFDSFFRISCLTVDDSLDIIFFIKSLFLSLISSPGMNVIVDFSPFDFWFFFFFPRRPLLFFLFLFFLFFLFLRFFFPPLDFTFPSRLRFLLRMLFRRLRINFRRRFWRLFSSLRFLLRSLS